MILSSPLGRGVLRVRITDIIEVSKHLALYPVRIAQIVHMLQHETRDIETGSFNRPRERVAALLLFQLTPHRIKDVLQLVECFRVARTRADLHETTPSVRCGGRVKAKSLSD